MHTIFQHALSKISRILQMEVLLDASLRFKEFDPYVKRVLSVCDYIAKYAAELAEINVGKCTLIRSDDMAYKYTPDISGAHAEAMGLNEPYAVIFKRNYLDLSGYFDTRYTEYKWIPPNLKWQLYPQSIDDTISIPTKLKKIVKAKRKILRERECVVSRRHIKAPFKYYHKDSYNDLYNRFDSIDEILPAWEQLLRSGRYVGVRAFMFKLRNTHEYLKIRREHDMLYANQINRFMTEENVLNLEKRLDWIFISLGHVVTFDLWLTGLIQKVKNRFDKDPDEARYVVRENAGIFKVL